ncbi:MAG: TonB-dependent receptor plug domain-containing protein [Methylococcales bacterium]|nr:TonB-dependent receptor plug domain-containing protein [Methylococcales bacterium]
MDLSVEDLLNVEVISVSKKAKSLNDSPAAIYVINQSDIKWIGATSIPEALRLAPGLDVARVDANKWAVSARGFNGRFANKLLVLVDGRNVYTRTFAGVYWENLGVMLEDVERIEVVRGPGATLWGANAVNGVINIITKYSAETQGGLLVAGGGTEENGFGAFWYGGELASDTTMRGYLKGFKKGGSTNEKGNNAHDNWDKIQGGFRIDSQLTSNKSLPGTPDIVFKKYKTAIFVQGCYWHRHENCKLASMPKQNNEFWIKKFNATLRRDGIVYFKLKQLGWRVSVIWECATRDKVFLPGHIKTLVVWLKSEYEYIEIPDFFSEADGF